MEYLISDGIASCDDTFTLQVKYKSHATITAIAAVQTLFTLTLPGYHNNEGKFGAMNIKS